MMAAAQSGVVVATKGIASGQLGGAVNDGEKMSETRRGRQRTHKIHVYVRKWRGWHGNVLWYGVGMTVNFCFLA